ncbi:uncharacterized protein LOC135128349 [Zophobas morio]|uniref:uncharacterized protein LOC135128349 n=1 Tax=Zophobas morio TaxID=2755281 RepID=UPI0030838244
MALSVWLFLIFSQLTLVLGNNWDCADFYWRDYFGTIPYDAVPAGKDRQGDNGYIGLVYNRGSELLPANVLPKEGIAQTTAHTSVINSTEYVKILCGPYKRAFVWIRVENPNNFHGSNYPNLIPGGTEVGKKVYITRVNYNGDVIVGKLQEGGNQVGSAFPAGNTIRHKFPFDVLSYDCSKQGIPCFDVRTGISEKQ